MLASSLLLVTVAAPQTVQLRYVVGVGADACPGGDDVRARVAARLGYDPFAPDAELFLIAEVSKEDDGFVGTVRREGGGRRTIRAVDCEELAEALALAISVAVDPAVFARPPPPPPETRTATVPPPPPPPTTKTATTPPPPPAPAPAPPPGVVVGARFGGGVAGLIGTAPGPTAGLLLLGGLTIEPAFALELEARAELPRTERTERGQVSVQQLLLGLLGCYEQGGFVGCARLSTGITRGTGQELDGGRSRVGPYVGLGGRIGWAFSPAGAFVLRPFLEVEAALARTTFRIGDERAWRTPPLWGGVGLQALGDFP